MSARLQSQLREIEVSIERRAAEHAIDTAVELHAARPCVCKKGFRCANCAEIDVEVLIAYRRRLDEPEEVGFYERLQIEREEKARKGPVDEESASPPPDVQLGGVDRRPAVARYVVWDRVPGTDNNHGYSWVRCGGGWKRRGGS